MSLRADKSLIRALNRNLVLNLLVGQEALSRSELARRTGLSNATITEISSELLTSGLLEEVGEGESTGGRRPLLLRMNARAGFVVGVKLVEGALTCAVTDLHAHVLFHARYGFGEETGVEAIQAALISSVEDAIMRAGIALGQVLGIGIGLAGVVVPEEGFIRYSPYFGWTNVPFSQRIAAHFGLPVYLENDVNTLTLAEQWFGHGRGVENFAVVTVGRGVGSGYVLNGQFCHHAAGEIGHMTLSLDGPRCSCGKRGCLEALAADPAVIRAYEVKLYEASRTVKQCTLSDVVKAADDGNPDAIEVLTRAGQYLGVGVANLINTLSPQLIIMSGEGLHGGPFRLSAMHDAIAEHTFAGLAGQTRIVTEYIADETWARGAACVVLNTIFRSPMAGDSEIIARLVDRAV